MTHAQLSASSAHRWLTCTPSGNLAQHFNENKLIHSSSVYAEEGREAHEYAEIRLSYELGKISKAMYTRKRKAFKENAKFYDAMFSQHVDEYVMQAMNQIREYKEAGKTVHVAELELKVDFSEWVPGGFGTADLVIIAGDTLHVWDLKFGRGVQVSVVENPQLKLYALGAYSVYSTCYSIENIRMTICQPRLYHTNTWGIPVRNLLDWGVNYVATTALLAKDGLGIFMPTEKACRFCPARAICKPRCKKELSEDFNLLPQEMNSDDIAGALRRISDIKQWCKEVEDYALTQARDKGVKFKGFKLVEGRSMRKIADEKAVCSCLIGEGYAVDEVMPRKLQTLTALEKLVGRKKLQETIGELIIKAAGKPTLVPEDDKRVELNSAKQVAEEFKDLKQKGEVK
jgi:hypothetical protein